MMPKYLSNLMYNQSISDDDNDDDDDDDRVDIEMGVPTKFVQSFIVSHVNIAYLSHVGLNVTTMMMMTMTMTTTMTMKMMMMMMMTIVEIVSVKLVVIVIIVFNRCPSISRAMQCRCFICSNF